MESIGSTTIYHSLEELKGRDSTEPLVATLGLFDGVHLGHQHLIEAMMEMARRKSAKSLIITLDQHPLRVLVPESQPPLQLASLHDRLRYLARTGADNIVVLPFTKELSQRTPQQFISPFIECGVKGMMLGYDNRFGRKLPGETLEHFDADLQALGLDIERVTTFEYGGLPISSSRIRSCLANKNFSQLESLLGRPYSLTGVVQGGRKLGRTISYPTANIIPSDPMVVLPEVGVYVSEVRIGEETHPSMAYYGSTPTVTGSDKVEYRIEAFIFDYARELYGIEVEVAFREFIRPDHRFPSLEALRQQLQQDEVVARRFFSTHSLELR